MHSPKSQHYWSLAIRLFSVISRTLAGEVIPYAKMQLVYSIAPANRDIHIQGSADIQGSIQRLAKILLGKSPWCKG